MRKTPGYATQAEALEQGARSLAASHRAIERPRRPAADFLEAPTLARSLEQAQGRLASVLRQTRRCASRPSGFSTTTTSSVAWPGKSQRSFRAASYSDFQCSPAARRADCRDCTISLAHALVVDEPIEVDAAR
jgi:hypothetical protein